MFPDNQIKQFQPNLGEKKKGWLGTEGIKDGYQ